jgi:hypothetical protein
MTTSQDTVRHGHRGRPAAPRHRTSGVRQWIVRTTIAAFSVAALMGIAALLRPGSFGQTEGNVLLTTLLVGTVSIAVLCYLSTAGGRYQPVGVAGGVAVVVPFVTGLLLIWMRASDTTGDTIVKVFGVGTVVAATLAQASLMLSLGSRAEQRVKQTIWATLGLAAVLAVMVSLLILGLDPSSDFYVRVLGVVAILDVLGTVVATALARFGTARAREADRPTGFVALPGPLMARLHEEEQRTGLSATAIVTEALEFHLSRRSRR